MKLKGGLNLTVWLLGKDGFKNRFSHSIIVLLLYGSALSFPWMEALVSEDLLQGKEGVGGKASDLLLWIAA